MKREETIPGMIVYTQTCGSSRYHLLLRIVKHDMWVGSNENTFCTPLLCSHILHVDDDERIFGANIVHNDMIWIPVPKELTKDFKTLELHLRILGWEGDMYRGSRFSNLYLD